MSNEAKWVEVEILDDPFKFPGETDTSDEQSYLFDDERDENTPIGLFLLLDAIIGVGIIVAFCNIVKVIWKRFLRKNR